jgi:hypothetical protein
MRLPKVLIFTPIYDGKDYCFQEFVENIKKFTYKNKEHIFVDNTNDGGVYFEKIKTILEPLGIKVFHVERGNSSREALARAQNFARNYFLNGDYDNFLSLESDIFPKANIVEALVSHTESVVTALYMLGFEHDGTRTPCITLDRKVEKTGTSGTKLIAPQEFKEYINKGKKEVAAGGMGCCLIERDVLEKIKFTFIPGLKGHSDVFFFNDVRRNRYKVYVDTNMYCEHKNSDWTKVKDY